MYLKISDTIINANHLVTARVSDDGEVVLNMSSGDEVRLRGDEAEAFLRALPVYEPVTGDAD